MPFFCELVWELNCDLLSILSSSLNQLNQLLHQLNHSINSTVLLNINPDNPQMRHIQRIVECLRGGGVIIYPTDTVYGMGCDINNRKAVEQVCRLKGIKPEKANLSIMCNDLSQMSEYAVQLDNRLFKMMKKALPGPYTIILKANNSVPKLFKNNKRTIGIRIPNNNIVRTIVEELGNPILTTSLKTDDEIIEHPNDPFDINEQYQKTVDIIIDGGLGGIEGSTIVDCTGNEPEIIREGAGDVEVFM